MRLRLCSPLIGVALALTACGERSAAPPPAPQAVGERWRMKIETVPDFKPVAATVTTRDMADARARIGGTLARLTVREGDVVHKGQLIGLVSDERIGFQTGALRVIWREPRISSSTAFTPERALIRRWPPHTPRRAE
jgi:multidrug efflux pump subunit AcrA (membrane-fusion protein)